ncbi:translation initiation factor IF-5A [Candidatus Thorarchaeota archaeon]|nr:MAG: translation initiation factor IF-5A [Candidatus Thorarchaeota archaeon]
MSIKKTSAKSLKPGSYFVIDGEPCKVTNIEKSKPGKHGSAKANITAIGFFDNRKRNVIMPADRMVDVPIIDKRSATVIAEMGERFTLMDTETYETYDIKKPTDPEIASKMELNKEVEVWELMGERVITRVKS